MAFDPAAGTLISALRVGACIESISEATSWLGEIAEAEEWPAGVRFGLELSLEEALTNVVSYGFKDVGHAPLRQAEAFDADVRRVAVRILDNGIAFDPTAIAEPDVPESIEDARIGGHGVQLMRNFLESLAYRREDDRNQLTLVAGPGQAG